MSRLVFVLLLLSACAGGPSREQLERAQQAYELGVGLFTERNLPAAFEQLQTAVELDPDHAEAHYALGTLFFLRGDYAPAERHLLESIRANAIVSARGGLEADARNSLGVIYIHTRRLDDAERVLRQSATDLMNRDPAVSWANLGWALYEAEDYPAAREALRQSLQISPTLCLAWYRSAQVLAATNELAEAEAALGHVLDVEDATCRQMQRAWRLRGDVRGRLGHREEAVEDLEHCVEMSSETEDGEACRELLGAAEDPGTEPDPEP